MCCSVLQCVAVHTYTQDSDTLDCRLPVFLLSCMAPQIMGRRTGGYSTDTPPYMQTFRQRCVAVCCSVLNTLHTHKYTPPYTQTFRQRHCILTPQMMRAKETAYIHLKDNSLHIPKGQEPTYTYLYAETSRYRHYILTSICEFSRAFIFTVCNTKNLLLYFSETVCLKKILMYFSETVCLSYFYCFLCLFVHPYPFAHT